MNASRCCEAITAERMALLEGVTAERVAVVNALHEERIATLQDAELAAQRLIDYTLSRALELLIDHVLWRVFLGLAAARSFSRSGLDWSC